jgi:hypothetical protein
VDRAGSLAQSPWCSDSYQQYECLERCDRPRPLAGPDLAVEAVSDGRKRLEEIEAVGAVVKTKKEGILSRLSYLT